MNVDRGVLVKLKRDCQQFFNAVSLLLSNVTPTVWTIGYAVPRHSELLFEQFGVGLGINSMQGYKAKHVCLKQYAGHSNLSQRWSSVLKHDYISSVWIRKFDPYHFSYKKSWNSFIPNRIQQSAYCHCGFEKDETEAECLYCSSALFKAIDATASSGKLSPKLNICD